MQHNLATTVDKEKVLEAYNDVMSDAKAEINWWDFDLPIYQLKQTGAVGIKHSKIYPYSLRERFKKKKLKKKLTNVSFAFTHTYTPVKTNIFRFFPQSYMENFEKCAKTQKQKNNMLSHVTCGC